MCGIEIVYLPPLSNLPSIIAIQKGDFKAIAKALSLIENETEGYEAILENLTTSRIVPIIGFTGPPGAGKSSIVHAIASLWAENGLKVAIIAVDPSSLFNLGALLGDRLRMSGLFTHPNIFIRSVASRGYLGGLAAFTIRRGSDRRAARPHP